MKKMLSFLLAMVLALSALPALADGMKNPIPDEIAALFDVPAWAEYHIPVCTDHPDYYAYARTDEVNGYCAALIILRKESEQRNVLCLLEKKDGQWRITGRNHEALPRGEEVPYLYCEMNDQLEVHWGNWEQGDYGCVYFTREDGAWLLRHVQDQAKNLTAYVSGKSILYYDAQNDGSKASEESVYGVYDRRFAAFHWSNFPQTVAEARTKLTNPPVTPTDFYTPVTATLRANEKYDVYTAPGRDSHRASNGKAVMSTNDWVQIFGEEDGWLLVQYDISNDQMRFGYIDASALTRSVDVPTLTWYDLPEQTLKANASVTDDPLASQKSLCVLEKGHTVKVLSTFDNWYYIETTNEYGQLLRGFVLQSCIDLVYGEDLLG